MGRRLPREKRVRSHAEISTEPVRFLHDSRGSGYAKSFVSWTTCLVFRMLYEKADEVAQSGHAEGDIGQSPCPCGPDFLI